MFYFEFSINIPISMDICSKLTDLSRLFWGSYNLFNHERTKYLGCQFMHVLRRSRCLQVLPFIGAKLYTLLIVCRPSQRALRGSHIPIWNTMWKIRIEITSHVINLRHTAPITLLLLSIKCMHRIGVALAPVLQLCVKQ